MARGPEIPLWKRHIIIAYHVQMGMSNSQIARQLNLSPKAVTTTITRAKSRCQTGNLDDLIEAVAVLPRPGRPQRAPPGSEASLAVREGVQHYHNHPMDLAANHFINQRQALGELDPNIQYLYKPQVYHCLQDPQHSQQDPQESRPITRKRELARNDQNEAHINDRLRYLGDLQQLDDQNALIICTDEKGYHFGGSPNRRTSQPKGVPGYGPRKPQRFKIEQWAAACGDDCGPQRPWIAWHSKAPEITPQMLQDLEQAKQTAKGFILQQRTNCSIQGTPEFNLSQRMNTYSQEALNWYQANDQPAPYWTPEQLYPMHQFVANDGGKAMDYVFYAFKIYRGLLFPYYHALKQANPNRKVVIQEDNAPPHLKARRLLQAEIFEQGIEFIKHPSNSPDLAPIETVQWEHQKRLEPFMFEVRDSKKATKDKAMRMMKELWQSPEFDEVVIGRACRQAYLTLGLRAKAALGTNRINDDVNIRS